jgi:hypothetical protein
VSWGTTAKDLHAGAAGAPVVSRLTYGDLLTHSGELYGVLRHPHVFVSGFAGYGVTPSGNLHDEDLPPYIVPYSNTLSTQKDGSITYAVIDVGHNVFIGPRGHVGGFVGYSFFRQTVNAFGCQQTATNLGICGVTIPDSVKGISQTNNWNALRIGVSGDVSNGQWRLSGDAAWLPFLRLNGADTHWLRLCGVPPCFTGPIPEDGKGWGFQLQAMLDYNVTSRHSIGAGVRYWHMQSTGLTHFEGHVLPPTGTPQGLDWTADIFGVTLQTAWHF